MVLLITRRLGRSRVNSAFGAGNSSALSAYVRQWRWYNRGGRYVTRVYVKDRRCGSARWAGLLTSLAAARIPGKLPTPSSARLLPAQALSYARGVTATSFRHELTGQFVLPEG